MSLPEGWYAIEQATRKMSKKTDKMRQLFRFCPGGKLRAPCTKERALRMAHGISLGEVSGVQSENGEFKGFRPAISYLSILLKEGGMTET